MKFSTLIAADLAPENQVVGNEKAAIPAIPAIHVDLQGNSLAIPLLFSAISLLFDDSNPPETAKNSNRIATNSSRIANEDLQIRHWNQSDTEKIAGIAKIAGLAESQNANSPLSPTETAALAILKELYQQHRQRLVDGGHSPQGARVRGDTYRAALLARGIPLEAAITLRQAKRVKSDGLYWSLVDEVML
ncbi:MAG: hypothetical protein ABTQ93_16495 [Candidatus Competibacter denitrificans]